MEDLVIGRMAISLHLDKEIADIHAGCTVGMIDLLGRKGSTMEIHEQK